MSANDRKVASFVNHDYCDFIEAEIVDYDNRNIAYRVWDNSDGTLTLHVENPVHERDGTGQTTFACRRSREALRDMLQGVLSAIDAVKPRAAEEPYAEPAPEEFVDPPEFRPVEPWLPRS